MLKSQKKVIFIDWNIFVYRAIFTHLRQQNTHAPFLCLCSILACLKKIEINIDDIIILAVDSQLGSWRKSIDINYKSDRKEKREKYDINWTQQYGDFDKLLENLKIASPFHVIKIDKLEADDIIAYGVQYFRDYECVIISSDSDFDQLVMFENVKLFSAKTKKYKIIKNPHKSLAKKILKEATDNLVTPVTNEYEYEKRNKIVNLQSLPKEIEELVCQEFIALKEKVYDISLLQFPTLVNSLQNIYNNEQKKITSFSDSFKKKKEKVELQTLDI